ncbi:FtsX-like permease family protein [Aliishimia ponticola]|uniref:FtsX-like permease family protein n=1 Tax=Aliishimia ponticola TaxID=2499833 RepID=A0A4S4N9V6_9RHOB|nr:FtsX-like permease family protein [Aliishimia ponticola]THH36044.1 FtsX-like permease family protein [Aliishimia ponticola]
MRALLSLPKSIWRRVTGAEAQSDRVVPPSGFTAQLTLFASAAMAFLAVFALALSLASGRLADRWEADLAAGATIRVVTPAGQQDAQVAAALRVLDTTAGVASARALTAEEHEALLAPWLGEGLDLSTLPAPRLIEIEETADGSFDPAGLRLRLAAEAPGAVLDDHRRWREPLTRAAGRLRSLGWIAMVLILATTGAMITLAANVALAANAQVISVLRLVGATDAYIARAFVRRFTLRAGLGALIGTLFGVAAILFLPSAGSSAGILTGLGFAGWHWFLPWLVPVLAAFVAFIATRASARRTLGGLT